MIVKNSFSRFLIVGGFNSLFGFSVYALFALTAMETWKVLLISNFIGMLFNFFTAGHIVFFDTRISKMPRFLLSYITIYVVYLVLINWLEPIVDNRITAMAIIVVPVAVATYFIQKFFVYRHKLLK
jgi:putative flippase GtrA